jgi:hypothetical protein
LRHFELHPQTIGFEWNFSELAVQVSQSVGFVAFCK